MLQEHALSQVKKLKINGASAKTSIMKPAVLGLLTGAVAVAVMALLLGTRRPLQTDPDFAEIAPQLFRHNFEMNLGIIVPVATFLIQLQQSSWVLVDTGAGTEQHCKSLIKGVKAKLGSADDRLRLVLRELRGPKHAWPDQLSCMTSGLLPLRQSSQPAQHAVDPKPCNAMQS